MAGLKKIAHRNESHPLDRTDNRMDSRTPDVYSYSSFFNVPKSIQEADYEHKYSFIPLEAGGRSLKNDYDYAVEVRKFRPVLASECPELARRYTHDPFGRTADQELIIRGGQILMKRTKEDHEREAQLYDEQRARHNYIRDNHSRAAHNIRMIVDDRQRANY